MRYFRYEMDGPEIHLYPIVCWHIGAIQSSEKFIDEMLNRIKADPLARVIYMGDGGECVTRNSKGNIYKQLLSPGEQLRVLVDMLYPIREKILYGIKGNHGDRIDRESGLGWDENLAARVGFPYMGTSCLADVKLNRGSNTYLHFSLYTHHGAKSNAVTPQGKTAAAYRPVQFIQADLVLTAHTHACMEAPRKIFIRTSPRNRRIEFQESKILVCGSAYDSRIGYAEEAMYPPIIPEHLSVAASIGRTFEGGRELPTSINFDVDFYRFHPDDLSYTSETNRQLWKGNNPPERTRGRDYDGPVMSSCPQHPRYKGQRQPKGNCEGCWRIYLNRKGSI